MKVKVDISDLVTMYNELNYLRGAIRSTEQHLVSAENALVEKEEEMERLKKKVEKLKKKSID